MAETFTITVEFDQKTWSVLESLSTAHAVPKAQVLRRGLRMLAWAEERQSAGYKLCLLKEGQVPVVVELSGVSEIG